MRRSVRPTLVLALTWMLASVLLTALLAPRLGARGLMWLGVQDLLCLVGCGFELAKVRWPKEG